MQNIFHTANFLNTLFFVLHLSTFIEIPTVTWTPDNAPHDSFPTVTCDIDLLFHSQSFFTDGKSDQIFKYLLLRTNVTFTSSK